MNADEQKDIIDQIRHKINYRPDQSAESLEDTIDHLLGIADFCLTEAISWRPFVIGRREREAAARIPKDLETLAHR